MQGPPDPRVAPLETWGSRVESQTASKASGAADAIQREFNEVSPQRSCDIPSRLKWC